MNKFNRSIPLAFLLAVAADTSGVALGTANDAPVLTHGMLADLLAGSVAVEPDGRLPETKVAQFRNYGFSNCATGSWRNC
jgi:hypothetical protein